MTALSWQTELSTSLKPCPLRAGLGQTAQDPPDRSGTWVPPEHQKHGIDARSVPSTPRATAGLGGRSHQDALPCTSVLRPWPFSLWMSAQLPGALKMEDDNNVHRVDGLKSLLPRDFLWISPFLDHTGPSQQCDFWIKWDVLGHLARLGLFLSSSHSSLPLAVAQRVLPLLKYVTKEVLPTSPSGSDLASGGPILEQAETNSVWQGSNSWCLLTEATPVARATPLPSLLPCKPNTGWINVRSY